MARTHLTLAALATAAVPGLDVQSTRSHTGSGHGEFESAVVTARDSRQIIIRMPRNASAETEQAADLVSLRALTTGVRSRLPFDVPTYLGQAPVGSTRAMAYDFLPGESVDLDSLTETDGLAASVGRAVAGIHSLPAAFIGDAGLPQQSAPEARAAVIALVTRAADTSHLPAALLRRWEEATDDDSLWRFAPAVINGNLSADSLLISDDAVSAVIGWSGLRVGDPARDLHWLLAARGDAAESALAAYAAARGSSADRLITQRAMLYAELELARWLLHGIDLRDQRIIDDAVSMLDNLVDSVHGDVMNPLSATGPVLAVADVEALLGDTPRPPSSGDSAIEFQTDSYDPATFELGSPSETGPTEWVAEAVTGLGGGQSHDDVDTGPIELFSISDDGSESTLDDPNAADQDSSSSASS